MRGVDDSFETDSGGLKALEDSALLNGARALSVGSEGSAQLSPRPGGV